MPLPMTSLIESPYSCQRPTARRRVGRGVVVESVIGRQASTTRDQWRQRHHRADDAGAEQRAFHRAADGLAHRPEAGLAEQRADAVQAQARAFEAAGEQVEAATHEAAAGQWYGDTGDRTGDGRRDDAAPAPRRASTARPEPQAEADRGAQQQPF